VATGSPRKAVANDMFRQWTEEDREEVRRMLDAAYDIFRDRVREGRRGAIAEQAVAMDGVANGSIFSAEEAMENGLIDVIGYLDDAIAQAEQSASLPAGQPAVIRLYDVPSLFGDGLLGHLGLAAPAHQRLDADAVRSFVNELNTPRVMYLMH
jgi:protease-4